MKLNELTFSWEDQSNARQEAACNVISLEEIWNHLASVYDVVYFNQSYMKNEVKFSSWEDQDGYNHLIFIRSEKDGIKESDRKCYSEFYNNTFGTGIFCSRMTVAEYKHHICRCHVEGYENCQIDFITVLSFLRLQFHSGYTFLMRLLMDWMYLVEE